MRTVITTDRLVLRQPTLGDAKTISRLLSDKAIVRMTASIPYPFCMLSAEFWIMQTLANWDRDVSHSYIITDGKNIIGDISLFNAKDGSKELGYWIGKPYWGKGYASESAKAIIAESFDSLDIPHIDAGYFDDNPASGHILGKLGFVSKNEFSHLYSIGRGTSARGIELRLHRKSAMKMQNTNA
ncbi:MAG: GNAT family N-acetyltransferase [Robiginitomaculum sp.]|nr:MAG: GNAT family N-acetyltransferase [Robiginitomaculum sp.]